MFSISLDSKPLYKNKDGDELANLSKSVYKTISIKPTIYEIYKTPKDYEMRPDLIAYAVYGSEKYTDLILKNSEIPNPFSVEFGDVVVIEHLQNIDSNINTEDDIYYEETKNALKNYHKYIDKSKIPSMIGSEENNIETEEYTEPNLQKDGNNGITIMNGKIYFGDVPSSDTTEDTGCIDCKNDGMSLGSFLTTVLKNNNA